MPKDIFAQLSSNKIKDFLSDECNLKRTELLGKYMGNMINTLTNILNIDLIIFTGKFYKTWIAYIILSYLYRIKIN